MSHHVFVQKKPMKHKLGFGVLFGLLIVGVVVGWTLTTGRAMLASMDAARADLGAVAAKARQLREEVVPTPAPAPQEAVAPTESKPDFDPVIERMKEKLETDQPATETTE